MPEIELDAGERNEDSPDHSLNRRHFLKTSLVGTAAAALGLSSEKAAAMQTGQSRLFNILYIHSHDTGRFTSPYGWDVPTPNLQRLASEGILFRQAFSAAPTCSPSRASLLTVECPHSNGMLGPRHHSSQGFSPQCGKSRLVYGQELNY